MTCSGSAHRLTSLIQGVQEEEAGYRSTDPRSDELDAYEPQPR